MDIIAGRYRLEARVGSGGSAEVWRARDLRLDRPVALKRLHADLMPDRASRRRFAAEARAAAGISHPGILPVFDVVEDGRSIAIVLGFLDGHTLAEMMRHDRAMPEPMARSIAAQVADALAAAHRSGVVHLDVKPGNVLLDESGRPRLVDFGIARLVEDAERRASGTDEGKVLGTLRYMAPEQLAGGAVGPRTDLYAVGLLLVEMLTGHAAFDGATPREVLDARLNRPPNVDGVPDDLVPLVRRLLDPDPAARPATAEEVRDALAPDLAAAASVPPPPAPATDDDRWAVTGTVAAMPVTSSLPVPAGNRDAAARRGRSAPSPRTAGLVLAGALALVAVAAALGGISTFVPPGPGQGAPAVAAPSQGVSPTATPPPADGGGDSNRGGKGNGRGGGNGGGRGPG